VVTAEIVFLENFVLLAAGGAAGAPRAQLALAVVGIVLFLLLEFYQPLILVLVVMALTLPIMASKPTWVAVAVVVGLE
jgi:hypothetical protein